jgi:deoxyribodipyrimidine photolyase-related protein
MRTAVWIFGDQVDRDASSLKTAPQNSPIVFVESKKFCQRRPYHWQKLVLIFSAMRHFAAELKALGREVHYFPMADDFATSLATFVKEANIDRLYVMEPNDVDRTLAMPAIARKIKCEIEVTPNTQFLATHDQFDEWAQGKRSLVMESFYRLMRKRLGVLLDPTGSPLGGTWNLDKLNRIGAIPKDLPIPPPDAVKLDPITLEVIDDVHRHFKGNCFGSDVTIQQMRDRFIWPVTPAAALARLQEFLTHKLANFGPYEDAMTTRSWFLWHSHLSVSMNCGLLHPKRIVEETLAHAMPLIEKNRLPLNSAEGFLRQVIGWREFIRGIYWREMRRQGTTAYTQRNELNADHPLPDFYWSAQTDMNCVRHCIEPVIEHGYSHHIPRLMVLANFALLHGISPQQVNEWFIYAYADGYEWVTTPNVVGMALYADGGIVATKPYAAGGAYINRMSNYCAGCRYNPKKAEGADACPFTRAYWPFLDRHRKRLEHNPRVSLTIKNLDRFTRTQLNRRAAETDAWLGRQKAYAQPG